MTDDNIRRQLIKDCLAARVGANRVPRALVATGWIRLVEPLPRADLVRLRQRLAEHRQRDRCTDPDCACR